MSKISAFVFTNKDSISLSGISIKIIASRRKHSYKLYRQFEGYEKEFLLDFNCDYPVNKLITFEIKSKNKDLFAIKKRVQDSVKDLNIKDEELLKNDKNFKDLNIKILKIWQKHYNSKEFILENYKGYMFLDEAKNFWIYDIIPTIKEYPQNIKDCPLPTPGTKVTYIIEIEGNEENTFTQTFTIPETLTGEFDLFDIFKQDRYLYHVALYYQSRCIWSKFTTNTSNRRAKFVLETNITKTDLISNIKPDITTLPFINPKSKLFTINDKPPALTHGDLMDTTIKATKIMIDINDPNNFNSISIESKFFKSENFPNTFSLIYPHK